MFIDYSSLSATLQKFLMRYGFTAECEITLAGIAGSKRAYYRLREGINTFIVLQSPEDDLDFGRFLRITQFYRLMNFPVPSVYCIDDISHQVILEDLGNQRLYDWAKAHFPAVEEFYQKTITVLIDMQTRCFALHKECPDINSRLFDKHDLLWETQYYTTQYLEGYLEKVFSEDEKKHLQQVFEQLADKVEAQPKSIMHRDFQSQNIMLQADGHVRIIDYQGSRLGSIYYDLASLLLDPYVLLTDEIIETLLRFYHVHSLNPLTFAAMQQQFYLAAAQRIMQALGAYCFLSRVKGIAQFADYIEPGEKRLRWVVAHCEWVDLKAILP